MQEFQLLLKNEKANSYKLLFLLFIFLNLAFVLALSYVDGSTFAWTVSISCLLLTAAALGAGTLYRLGLKAQSGRIEAVLLIMLAFALFQAWWACIALAVLTILYFIAIRTLVVLVREQEIIYPAFPKKHIAWSELNNIILKDGILTIDFRNDKLAQSNVVVNGKDYASEEQDFNEFCRIQLEKKGSPRTL